MGPRRDELIAGEQAKIETDRRRLKEEAAALDANREALRQEFEVRVQQLVKAPGALLADLAILRLVTPAFQGVSASNDPGTIEQSDATAAPPPGAAQVGRRERPGSEPTVPIALPSSPPLLSSWRTRTGERTLVTLHESRRAIRAACRAAGVPATAGLTTHAALLSGLCPVALGPKALDLLEAYAQVITGGRLCWVPIGPTILDPTDLLGRPDSQGHMVLHAAGLLELLVEAERKPDQLTLVVFDGIMPS